MIIYTIGHSTRPIKSLIEVLDEYKINQVIDVRTIPYSRYNPQFNKEELAESLKDTRIVYVHMIELGGLRHPKKDSVNIGWENASFRGYADYMQTDHFKQGIEKLIEISKGKNTVILCSEAVPWRCHRSLIADALLVRKIKVNHIINKTSSREHEITPFAKVRNRIITYPKQE